MISTAIRPTEVGRAVLFFQQPGPKPFNEFMHVDFQSHVARALKIARRPLGKGFRTAILAFGYQGNGKNAFARCVAQELVKDEFSTLWIDFEVLRVQEPEELDASLSELKQYWSIQPLLLIASGLDLLAAPSAQKLDLAKLSALVVERKRTRSLSRVLIIATAERPSLALPFLPKSVKTFYLPWPSRGMAAQIFRTVGVPRSNEVAAVVLRGARERGVRYTARSLIVGARQAVGIAPSVGGLEGLSVKSIADLICAVCSPTPESDAVAYEADNASSIHRSAAATKLAPREYS